MLSNLYTKYFAKNKPLRHIVQHLLAATAGLILISVISKQSINLEAVFLFFLFTYIPDIDGLLAVFLGRNQKDEARMIIDAIKNRGLVKAATHATIYHKKFNRMIIHNIIGLGLVIIIFLYGVINKNIYFIYIFGAILTHFIFDMADDVYQLGNINNWLWPYKAIFKRKN